MLVYTMDAFAETRREHMAMPRDIAIAQGENVYQQCGG